MSAPGAEPHDGDFVAYLRQIELRQQAQLARTETRLAASTTAPALKSPHWGAAQHDGNAPPRAPADLDGLWRKAMPTVPAITQWPLGVLISGTAGVALLLAGLLGELGLLAAALGGFLIYRAGRALRRARRRDG
jgi:hypothetical protein